MRYLLNLAYALVLLALSPWLLYQILRKSKLRRGLWEKLTGAVPARTGAAPAAWFHGVSVGEIHLLRGVVKGFRQRHPDWECIVTTTTETGYQEACKSFPDLDVCYWPFDFSWAVRRALHRLRPALVVLAEGEIWPNFLLTARRYGLRLAIINGRLSPRSARRYRALGRPARFFLRSVDLILVQTEEYADAFRGMGVDPARVQVTGSIKYDGWLPASDPVQGARIATFRQVLQIRSDDLVWIVGSTQEPEEAIALAIFQRLQAEFPQLRLLLVPRQRERFDGVARLLAQSGLPFVRRSELNAPLADRRAVVLVDTIGELSALWPLATVAFVGGSLDGKRGGQNMIEPAAHALPVLFGPHVWNFAEPSRRLLEVGGAIQVQGEEELETALRELLAHPERRHALGERAKCFVLSQQGASARTLDWLDRLVLSSEAIDRAA